MSLEDKTSSFDDRKTLIAKTLQFVKGVDAQKMDGIEDREITFPVGDSKMRLKGADYLLHFSMPNFYFYVTTASRARALVGAFAVEVEWLPSLRSSVAPWSPCVNCQGNWEVPDGACRRDDPS